MRAGSSASRPSCGWRAHCLLDPHSGVGYTKLTGVHELGGISMRRALPALFALVLALALAVPAMAATPSPARMAAPSRKLQGQVKKLQKAVKKTKTKLLPTKAVRC